MADNQLSELRKEVGEIRELAARTDANVDWIRDAIDHQVKRGDDHDKRLSRVERWQHWMAGIGAAIVGLLGIGGGHGLKP